MAEAATADVPQIPVGGEEGLLLRVLFVEDDEQDVELCIRELEQAGFKVSASTAISARELAQAICSQDFDVILSDYGLPGWRGDEVIDVVKDRGLEIPVVMVTGSLGDEKAADMIRVGAADFVLKERLARLPSAVHRALREKSIRDDRRRAEQQREQLVEDLRKREAQLQRVNRALRTTSECNLALVRATQETDLLQQVCRIIVEDGGYRLAWVGHATADDDLQPAAFAGEETGYLRAGKIHWNDPERPSPPGQALRHRQPVVVNDTGAACNSGPWCQEALRRGFGSQLALPLLSGDNPLGCLTIYAAETGAFDEEEVRLLSQLAHNLSFGICALRAQKEREAIEQQLRQAQKMEAVGRLAGGIAHDFNNLLNVIIGYSDLLLERHQPEQPIRKIVGEIRKAGERAALLTQHLLAFSRKQVLAARVLDLNAVLRDTADLLRRLLREDVQMEIVPAPALWPVRADPTQIGQVIINLATNARDAMPSGGRLTLETANVALDNTYSMVHAGCPPGRYVMLAVTDTGMGMDTETRSHIFEPFFTTKPTGKGTGLGLSTVYGIVKQSGGYIWVYSEPGQGTTFKIYLPATDAAPESAETITPATEVGRGSETILVVEDEAPVRALIHDYLEAHGYRVLQAANGSEAVDCLQGADGFVALVISDVVMPGMSGPELAERIRQHSPRTKILYISGYTQNSAMQRGVLQPGPQFLQKPFRPAELARKARQLLDEAGTAE